MLLGKVSEKPESQKDPGEKPEMKSITFQAADDTVPGKTAYYVKAMYTYKGKTIESETMKVGFFVGGTADNKEAEARASIQSQFDKDCQEWEKEKDAYNKWAAWKTARNGWLERMTQKGYFNTRTPGTEMDDYAKFWMGVASIALGKSGSSASIGDYLDNNDKFTSSNLDNLINTLYPQVYDENGEERADKRNLLSNKIDNINESLKDLYPDQAPDKPNQGGSGSDSTGNTGGGSSSGGGSGGGSSSGGSSSGGSSGGGSSSGGSSGGGSSSGGNSSGEDSSGGNSGGEDSSGGSSEEDTVAPSVEKIIIISPTTGVYTEGQEIKLRVDFDKNIYGTDQEEVIKEETAPRLFIKFGDNGEGKLTKFDSASDKSITYRYVIEENDNGKLQLETEDNYLGTVYNKDGYKAELKKIEKLEVDKEIEADNIAPQVEKIEVVSQEGEYKTEQEIEIKVTFNETIYTEKNKIPLIQKTAPNLNIRFGEGEIRNPVVKRIDHLEHYITYIYKITAQDRGALKIDAEKAFDGTKTVYDQVGNEVTFVAGKELEGNSIIANSELITIAFDKEEITLDLNATKTTKLKAVMSRGDVTLTWESSNQSVVKIEEPIERTSKKDVNGGNVTEVGEDAEIADLTAVGVGEAIITVKASDGTTETCKVTVKDTTNGNTKIELNQTKLELDLNGKKTENLEATVTPNKLDIQWSSTNEEVVTVDATGKVTAITTGEAQIIAKAVDGTTAICTVKVIKDGIKEIEPTSIALNIKTIKVILGKTNTVQLKTTITPPESNKNTKIVYESSDEEIATVNENGLVTIKSKGNVVITATSENHKSAYCAIEIIEDSELSKQLLGDVNMDEKVDTTDLLAILRHIAVSSDSKILKKHQDWLLKENKYIAADVNRNGIVDITDSLKLQRHIAASRNETIKQRHPDWIFTETKKEKNTEPSDKLPVKIYNAVGYQEKKGNENKAILSNYAQFKDYMAECTNKEEIMTQYQEQFFQEKSLAVVYSSLGNTNQKIAYEGYEIKENTITIKYRIDSDGKIGSTVMGGSIIIVEVNKNITQID